MKTNYSLDKYKLGLLMLLIALSILSLGCKYNGSYSFGPTRKLVGSNAPMITKIIFTPFLMIPDSLISPFTAYADAVDKKSDFVSDDGSYYISFIGVRTIHNSDMHPGFKAFGMIFTFPIDVLWFPIGGTIDVISVMTAAEPQATEPEKPPEARPKDTRKTGKSRQ